MAPPARDTLDLTVSSALELLGTAREAVLSSGRVRFRERGHGRPLVFLHGLLVNGLLWRHVVPPLAEEFRCITPDLPLGAHSVALKPDADCSLFGLASLVAELLEALDLDDVILVGNDSGGALCQAVVARRPARIGGLVLTPCDCYENYLPPIFRYLQVGAHLPGFVWLAAQVLRSASLRRLPITFGWLAKRPVEPAILDAYLRPTQTDPAIRVDTAKVICAIRNRDTLTVAREIQRFTRPVLLAWSREDRVFPWRFAERLGEDFPNARRVAIEDAYSFVPEDQPSRLVELVREFASEARVVRMDGTANREMRS
jgi:pimeloyl-ACP methyl ester carboxylesterase